MTAPKRYRPGRPRKHERRGPGRKVRTFAFEGGTLIPVRAWSETLRWYIVATLMQGALVIARRKAACERIADPDARAIELQRIEAECDAAERVAGRPIADAIMAIRNVDDAAPVAEMLVATHGTPATAPASRARRDYFSVRERLFSESNSDPYLAAEQALARALAVLRAPD